MQSYSFSLKKQIVDKYSFKDDFINFFKSYIIFKCLLNVYLFINQNYNVLCYKSM